MSEANIYKFHNGVNDSHGRLFPGMYAPHAAEAWNIGPRDAKRFNLGAGDLLSITSDYNSGPFAVIAYDEHGHNVLRSVGLSSENHLDVDDFACGEFHGWIDSMGGSFNQKVPAALVNAEQGEPFILKASIACSLWIAVPSARHHVVAGYDTGSISVSLKRAQSETLLLPEPLGDIREEFTISRGTAKAYELRKGDIVQIIDVEGQQCSDFMVFRSRDLQIGVERLIDSTVTRTMAGSAYPLPGLYDKFYDSDMRPLINVVQDTVGRHDTFALACTARGYEERGFPGHVNCSDNISDALDPFGIERRSAWPAINFFFNSWINHNDNFLSSEESWSRAGDYVAMKAMDDLVCVSTACPDDVDPINGWNPTDVHVRIYHSDTPIKRAIAHREKEDAIMSLSQESAFYDRTHEITQNFSAARDVWAPVSYPSVGTIGEYTACREAVTIQDMSGLRKYDVVGPDAERLLQKVMTRNISKIAVWRGSYMVICDEQGTVVDDGTLFRIGEHLFRWCCGSEESARVLSDVAKEEGLKVRINAMRSSMPNLAIQGPKSRDLLRKIVHTEPQVPRLDDIKWFGVTIARLYNREGVPFMLSRSGYTGELGYEIFCNKTDAIEVWDAVMEAGEEFGISPMGSAALEIIRIEAGLAAAGAEFTTDVDAFEAGLGFAVDLKKDDFIGKAALERNSSNPRRVLKGLILQTDDVPHHGSHIYFKERPVGVVTSATRSPALECAIAICRLAIEHSENGTELEVGQMGGQMKRLKGTVTDIPFIDPQRKRARV